MLSQSFNHLSMNPDSPIATMTTNAVSVADVSFNYGPKKILQNITLKVPKSSIYALLGPSGSGKTTLLRIILGRIKASSGSVAVFGNLTPGYFNRIIGYMPQSQALSPEMTVAETLNYFASIYQITEDKFRKKKQTLKRVLALENDEKIVKELSGGQQKALSLALVFLHTPKLVILDEPTVGTDPMLGDQIWSYLRSNSCQGVSVIIVTHYIQEAALADHVGMLRGGKMIEEGAPSQLYAKYGENNLEHIFIKICTEKTSEKEEIEKKSQAYRKSIGRLLSIDFNSDLVFRKKNSAQLQLDQNQIEMAPNPLFWLLFILVRRNLKRFYHSKLSFLMLFSPMFCTLLMCIIFSVDRINIPVAVFNEDSNPVYSNQFLKMSKSFLVHHMDYKYFDSLDSAIDAVENGHSIAALWFSKNFTREITKRALSSTDLKWTTELLDKIPPPKRIRRDTSSTTTVRPTLETEFTTVSELRPGYPVTNLVTIASVEDISEEETTKVDTISESTSEEDTAKEDPSAENSNNAISTETPEIAEELDNIHGLVKKIEEEELEDYEEDEEEGITEDEYLGGSFVQLSNETLKISSVRMFMNNANLYLTQPMVDIFNYQSWELISYITKQYGKITFTSPVAVKEIVYADKTKASDFLLPGYMIAFLYLSQVTVCCQLLIMERKDGFFDRAIVAGAKHSLMFFSHFIANLLVSLFQILLMFFIGFVWFGLPNFGSYWLAFILMLFQASSSVMTGLLISSLCKENFTSFFISLAITISQLFTSGAIFPIISFDPLIKFLINVTPITLPVESLRNLMLRGWNLNHYHVTHGLVVNAAITFVFGGLALLFFIRRS